LLGTEKSCNNGSEGVRGKFKSKGTEFQSHKGRERFLKKPPGFENRFGQTGGKKGEFSGRGGTSSAVSKGRKPNRTENRKLGEKALGDD